MDRKKRPARALGASHLTVLLLCARMAFPAAAVPRIEILEGEGAINNIRLHRAREPVVRVIDQDGNPIPNVAVSFVLPVSGASGTFADGKNVLTVMTDEKGWAVGRGLKPNGNAGQFQIRVSASYQGTPVTANITETNAEPAKGGSSKTILIVALIGGAAAAGVGVALGKGKSSSSMTTNTGGVVISPGNPSFGPPK